ncbi:amino-acid N-acetyltransferase [Marininema mesophilum]|uniref:Amino-acid N-acetyltransferase n=1 Tax=Marininema mesophilum TaxID=1048340 RepID=A0A1H2TAH4_9BACL|nr:hypothetical protein [Marininema mesophilum]SDW40695.1 amino-acid N-acetyltransferase [Marininema mesophilum]
MFTVCRAVTEDVDRIQEILRHAGLNEQGIEEHLPYFLVVEDPAVEPVRLVGTAGMEVYGDRGLLRSFVMEKNSWNAKSAIELVEKVLNFARQSGLVEVYLLAGISGSIFEHFGFHSVEWEEIPEDIRNSEHLHQSELAGKELFVLRKVLVSVGEE